MSPGPRLAPELAESEALAALAVLFFGFVVVAAWGLGAARIPIEPVAVFVAAIIGTGGCRRVFTALGDVRVSRAGGRLLGFLLVVTAFFAYVCWLAWPALLPLGEGPDLVHHLSLIHFLQQRHYLPYGLAFGPYLGEMSGYTPGSHLLAATVADWLGLDAVRVFHPLIAGAVALKAGLVYLILLRVLPGGRTRPASAVAGTLLLFLPHAYLLRPFTSFQFYAQVVAETFALAMIWALVLWHQHGRRRWLALFAFCGVVVTLTWPVWVLAPMAALVLVLLVQQGSPGGRLIALAVAVGPIAAVLAIYAATHTREAGILASGGATLEPSMTLIGWPFAALASAGVVLAVQRRAVLTPVLAFGLACAAQIVALLALQRALGASNPYLAYKTVHLLVYPVTICGALALDAAWRALAGAMPVAGVGAGWAIVPCVAAWLWHTDLPKRPVASPITLPVYDAGQWAKRHLPAPCIDYLVEQWLTAYWLHVDVLGNRRASVPIDGGRFGYRPTVGRWIEPGGLPYGIADDVDRLPQELRGTTRILQRFGPAAVIERTDGRAVCRDTAPPIDQVKPGE